MAPSPTYTIRPALPDDAEQLTDLIREPGLFARFAGVPFENTLGHVRDHLVLCLADSSHSVYVAVDDNELVLGYVSVHWLPYLFLPGPEGYVSELFIRDAARGQGIGKRLLDTVVEEARQRGCDRLQLVNFRNRESYERGFYVKAGWEERPAAASFVLTLN